MEKSTIKGRRRWALVNPCVVMEDCGRLGISVDREFGGKRLRTVLFVNLFENPLHWVAQIGIVGPNRQCIPLHRWDKEDARPLVALATSFLQDVGLADTQQILFDSLGIKVLRNLTAEEATTAMNAAGLMKPPEPALVGEIGIYNFNNRKTRVSQDGFQPVYVEKVYVKRTKDH